jgi:predicted PurR-regulated permease PerM
MVESSTEPPEAVHPHMPSGAAEWIRAGFFFMLGAALLGALAYSVLMTGGWVAGIAGPFVAGLVLAMMLDPVVDRLERRGRLPRAGAVAVVFLGVILTVLVIGALLVPVLIDRVGNLTQNGPGYVRQAHDAINVYLASHDALGPIKLPHSIDEIAGKYAASAEQWVQQGASRAASFLMNSATQALNTFVTLLIAFYLVLDIDRLRARLLYLMRPAWREPVARGVEDVRSIFAGFLTKLLLLCALYGVCMTGLYLALSIFQSGMLPYAVLMGVAGLLLYAVPYVGATSMALGSFALGWAASGSAVFGLVACVAALVLNGIFDNVVYPRLVGGGVGLHPVVAVFALVLGGSVLGIAGMILAVPTAASVQTLLYHMFPHLTSPTPHEFLLRWGVLPQDAVPVAETPEGPISAAETDVPRVILPPAAPPDN